MVRLKPSAPWPRGERSQTCIPNSCFRLGGYLTDSHSQLTPFSFLPKRVNIFEAQLRETDSSVRDILAETLRLVASYDFPDEWPDLIQGIVAQLQTGQVLR